MHIKILYGLLAFSSLLLAGNLYIRSHVLNRPNISAPSGASTSFVETHGSTYEEYKEAHINDCISIGTTYSGDLVLLGCGSKVYNAGFISNPEVYRYEAGKLEYIRHNEDASVSAESFSVAFGIDSVRFFLITQDERYVGSGNTVYYNEQPIKDADLMSFQIIGQYELASGQDQYPRAIPILYTKDKNRAYFKGKEIVGADSKTFHFISSGRYYQEYAADSNHVYYQGDVLEGADKNSFKPLGFQAYEGPGNGPYSVDKTHAYYKNILMTDVDVKTFSVVISDYAKDANHVYKAGILVPGANPKTFKFPVAEIG